MNIRNTVSRTLLGAIAAVVSLSACGSSTDPQLNATLVSVASGTLHSCGLTADGQAYCWGWNEMGQLGNGRNDDATTPQAVVGGMTFASITAGGGHTCGLTSDGTAYCWGLNINGQLGAGTNNANAPLAVDGGLKFVQIDAGGSFTCGVTEAGEGYCWGWNSAGQIGNGEPGDARTPTLISGGLTFESVSAAANHGCGLITTGEGYCWGSNASGRLGDGSTDLSPVPVAVAGGLIFETLDAGFNHTCGSTALGDAYCWGNDDFGQLGNGPTSSAPSFMPTLVADGSSYVGVEAGAQYTCGIRMSGESTCWGLNTSGQLGNDESTSCSIQIGTGDPTPVACNPSPTVIIGSLSFTSINPDTQHTCGIASDGAYCWGWGEKGQLGNGMSGASYLSIEPVRVLGQS